MPDDAATFTVEQALAAQQKLRDALGLGPERFPLPAFIGMISDEIEQMRRAGKTDQDVVDIVAAATGITIDVAEVATHYAPPDARARPA